MTGDGPGDSAGQRLVIEYRRARRRLRSLGAALDDHVARRPVPACPAWTIADLFAHLTGLAVRYGSRRVPDGDGRAGLDALVTARRGRRLVDVLAEWDRAGPPMEQAIAEQPDRCWPLVYDVIAHECDVLGALGRLGERDGQAVLLGLELGLRITARDLARHDLPGIVVVADGVDRVAGEGPTELTLEDTTFEVLRLLGSRRTLAEMRAAKFTGDLDRFLPALVHMQLPVESLGERPA